MTGDIKVGEEVAFETPRILKAFAAGCASVRRTPVGQNVLLPSVLGKASQGASFPSTLVAGILEPRIFAPFLSLKRVATICNVICYL